ncbi:Hypothetical predicted protein, partial [Paramuricea clavata]
MWNKVKHFTLSGHTKNVTIKVYNDGGKGAILASFSNKVVTDGSWECAVMDRCISSDCESFVATKWSNAIAYGFNIEDSDRKSLEKINEIKSTAQWIWVKNGEAEREWCRKRFAVSSSNQQSTQSSTATIQDGTATTTSTVIDDGNAEDIVSKQKLTQPQAQEYCSKHNVTLLYFQSTVNIKLQKGGPYWAGLVYNEVTKEYECSGDYLITGVVNKHNGNKCVIAEMKEKNKSFVLQSSLCCGNLTYAICKSQKDGVAIDTDSSVVTDASWAAHEAATRVWCRKTF